MKYGFTLPGRGQLATPERLGIIARKGEEFGFDTLLTGDHILVPKNISSVYPYTEGGEFPGSGSGESMEQITLLSYIAGQTSKIRLVTSVLIVPHRNPLIAAKSLATLDVLSGGRLVVGVGVGWMREEFQALGLPPFEERGAVTDEYIRAFKVLWTEDDPRFDGKYISFDDISFLPKPVQKPHPPIWVGGESRPALRRTAELADGWYPLGSNPTFPMGTPEQLQAGLDRLAQYAQRFSRDPSTIETIYRTHQFELKKEAQGSDRLPFVGDADQIAGDIRQYQDMGVTSMIWDFLRQTDDLDSMLGLMEDFAQQVWPKV
ncbi:MAG: LLM class F420-dependent oxidoreductase [Chloroflexi bacterium]|jgi:probable F420-dependent oxidoreductase|nr:LLM class F420-dependent oxidoreductase [Chloroflexota bacterium]MDP6496847.1 TIGR03619 family F420-dependent LLM class oxidoreductase [Dehalococcoidia bacterium]MQG11311.1 TIGR03619 family F420-dependent LLM class oxidoreductase [SAR202 cluster bacterium]MQG54577.1 TIGR03619 family F420-dependent LLM class oxidoreductase [SAR202 cluster bacterium]|tara:strand:- start:7408 stop:8361 length:954 start_codon:yes stop_codon:yes gene_type:complete